MVHVKMLKKKTGLSKILSVTPTNYQSRVVNVGGNEEMLNLFIKKKK